MAVCDLAVPILRPLKPKSQLVFTAQLAVKLANVLVTEKRGLEDNKQTHEQNGKLWYL